MKLGCIYAVVFVVSFTIVFAVVFPFFIPHNAPSDTAENAGRIVARFTFLPIAIIGFIIGYLRQQKNTSE